MPPNRTIPPAKIVKTERTHEENQERAYIAASRRSDRSLEARVESARRASEIHKRRTGRSLRVTEQDVINEEMYEEEDDDLPMQYRRLTAHLQTGSADFNRRLAAYLTNQVAMRNAVGQLATNHYSHHFGGGGMSYNQPRQNMFQTPAPQQQQQQPQPHMHQQHQQLQHQQQQQQHQMQQNQSTAAGFRPSPYPSPHHPGYRNNHGRAYSAAVVPTSKVQTPPTPMSSALDHRRMSTPAAVHPHIDTTGLKSDPDYVRQTQSAQIAPQHYNPYWQDVGPFTTSLPPESQQMLAGSSALDPNDPFSAALLHGSEHFTSSSYYPWNGGVEMNPMKGMSVHPSVYAGMSATLAPAAMATPAESLSATPNTNTTVAGDHNLGMSLDPLGLNHFPVPGKDGNSPHSLQSGQITPGESFWSNFVQDGGWNDEAANSG